MGNYWDSFDCQIQCEELAGYTEYEVMEVMEELRKELEGEDNHEEK